MDGNKSGNEPPAFGTGLMRPRSWNELSRRVLEQDYLTDRELEQKKHRAHQMKYALWLIPVALIGLAPSAIQDGPSWLDATIIALLLYGVISAYRLGARWERRWSDLIQEKAASSGRE